MSTSIEISNAMVSAALAVLYESGRLEFEATGADDLVIRRMLRAAFAHVPKRKTRLDGRSAPAIRARDRIASQR